MSQPIPQPPGIPLLGNIFDVDPSNTWTSLQKLAEQYGEIFQIKVFGQTIVFIGSAALAGELYDQKRFRKYVGGPVVEIRHAVHDALFTAYEGEANWGIAHRILAPRLSADYVAGCFDEMRDTASELLSGWKGFRQEQKVSLITELNMLNLEATALTLYGKKLNCLHGPYPAMLNAMEDSTAEAVKRPTRPAFLNRFIYGSKLRNATTTMRNWAAEIVDSRKKNPTDHQDVLAALMEGKDPQTGTSLTDSQVIDEIVSMPIGSSTAPCLISTAIYFLLKNPAVIPKARTELDTVIGDSTFTHAHLAKLPYIEAILWESLRLSFAAPGFNIEPIPSADKKPVQLAGGKYEVAHNQAMIVVLAGVNRDPAVYEEPLAFRPERMLGGKFKALPLAARQFFGNGKRVCIGKHWAWQFVMVALAKLIMEVDFEMADPGYEMKQDGWFNIRPVDFYVRVKPRGSA